MGSVMNTLEERKRNYIANVQAGLRRRGVFEEDIEIVIGKTPFYDMLNSYPEMQLHYGIEDTIDNILLVASASS